MSDLDPRTKMLVRTMGFIIFIVGLIAIYLGYTSPTLDAAHILATYVFGILTMVVGTFLIIAKYEKISL